MSKRTKTATGEVTVKTVEVEETKESRFRKAPKNSKVSKTTKTKKKTKVVEDEEFGQFTSTRPKRSSAAKKGDLKEKDVDLNVSSHALNPMLASKYDGTQDIKGWIMSEKLDGVRCVWDGETMRTRAGNLFYPPDYFIEKFPKDMVLDGELFTERGEFQKTVSIVRKHTPGEEWKKVKFLVFDGPAIPGPFSKRLKVLKERLSEIDSEYVELHHHEVCKDQDHLDAEMKRVTALNGEGMMIRDPKAKYEHRRVKHMLKVKEFHDDEATVIGREPGTGRLEGLMGALVVKNKAGKQFKVGSGFTDKERRNPPKKGTVITYRYFELTKDGIPRFPTYMRIHPGM